MPPTVSGNTPLPLNKSATTTTTTTTINNNRKTSAPGRGGGFESPRGGSTPPGGSCGRKARQPSTKQVQRLLRRITFRDAPSFEDFAPSWVPLEDTGFIPMVPLHLKLVGAIDLNKLATLHVNNPETKNFFLSLRKWLDDPSWYTELTRRRRKSDLRRRWRPRFAFGEHDLQAMMDYKYEATILQPTSWCGAWPRLEKMGTRRRPLFEPWLNDIIDRTDLPRMRQSTARRNRLVTANRRFSIQFDFSSFYDQMMLDPRIRHHFGVLFGNGLAGFLLRLPMGFRPSCHVAQSITWLLADFLPAGIDCTTCIDNVRFSSDDPVALAKAGREFVRRCAYVGATLNPPEGVFADGPRQAGLTEAMIEKLCTPQTTYEWLGVRYTHGEHPTRALGVKSLTKLKTAATCLAGKMSRRQVAAVFGMLFYASDIVGRAENETTIATHFDLLRFFRRVVTPLHHDPRTTEEVFWSEHVEFPVALRTQAALWIQRLSENDPVDVLLRTSTSDDPDSDEYDLIVTSDASEFGWGAVAYEPDTGRIHVEAAAWTGADLRADVHSSVVAEPMAVEKALKRFVSPRAGLRVMVLTDHTGLLPAMAAGYGKTPEYNALGSLVEWWGTLGCVVHGAWTPGCTNPVDGLSRGMQSAADFIGDATTLSGLAEAARELRRQQREERERARGGFAKWMV